MRLYSLLKLVQQRLQSSRDAVEEVEEIPEILSPLLLHHWLELGVEIAGLIVLHQSCLTLSDELGERERGGGGGGARIGEREKKLNLHVHVRAFVMDK